MKRYFKRLAIVLSLALVFTSVPVYATETVVPTETTESTTEEEVVEEAEEKIIEIVDDITEEPEASEEGKETTEEDNDAQEVPEEQPEQTVEEISESEEDEELEETEEASQANLIYQEITGEPCAEVVVKGMLPEGVKVHAVKLTYEDVKEYVEDEASFKFAYDVTLLLNGKEYQPEETVSVEFKEVENTENLEVTHVHEEDGEEEIKEVKVSESEDGNAEVEVDGFSVFLGLGDPTPASPTNCLTFKAVGGSATIQLKKYLGSGGNLDAVIYCQKSSTSSVAYTFSGQFGDVITLQENETVCFWNVKDRLSRGQMEYYQFIMGGAGNIEASGSVMSLVNGAELSQFAFYHLFDGCAKLTTAPELSASKLADSCYGYMFFGCTKLATAPVISATDMTGANGCYEYMFNGCTSLKNAPELPATTLACGCYFSMFANCTSLKIAPELPATTLVANCYRKMFYQCTALEMPADMSHITYFADNCCQEMYNNCSGLIVYHFKMNGYLMEWTFPDCTGGSGWNNNMLKNTAGPYKAGPNLGTTYYIKGDRSNNDCITFSSNDSFTIKSTGGKTWDKTIEYSTNKFNWKEWDGSQITALQNGNKDYLYFRGNDNSKITGDSSSTWKITGNEVSCSGNIETLRCATGNAESPTPMGNNCYANMFEGNTCLISIPELPATKLSEKCYYQMFKDCSSLRVYTNPPETYNEGWSIPVGATEKTSWNTDMFAGTAGGFTGSPDIGMKLYIYKIGDVEAAIPGSGDTSIGDVETAIPGSEDTSNRSLSSGGQTRVTTDKGTGSWNVPATGTWRENVDGTWSFGNNGVSEFKETWGYIAHSNKKDADWYYFGSDGKAKTGFQDIEGKTYYFREIKDARECAMETGWQNINSYDYHFKNTKSADAGVMDTGWYLDYDFSWYYMDKTLRKTRGTMQTGWITDPYDGYKYYLNPTTGKMATGDAVIDGKKYYFNETVQSASGWTQNASGDWIYEKREIIPLGALISR